MLSRAVTTALRLASFHEHLVKLRLTPEWGDPETDEAYDEAAERIAHELIDRVTKQVPVVGATGTEGFGERVVLFRPVKAPPPRAALFAPLSGWRAKVHIVLNDSVSSQDYLLVVAPRFCRCCSRRRQVFSWPDVPYDTVTDDIVSSFRGVEEAAAGAR
jgi:hypothetical protein